MTVSATGLPAVTRLVMTASTLLAAATTIMVALVVLRLVRSIAEGDPVALGSRALVTTGWIELVGGTLATWVGNVGDWFASMDLFWLHGWSAVDVDPDVDLRQLGWPAAAPLHLDVPAGPLAIGLVLALLAAVFRHGARRVPMRTDWSDAVRGGRRTGALPARRLLASRRMTLTRLSELVGSAR